MGAAPEKHPDWPQAAKEKETCATSSALEAQLVLSCCLSWTLKGLQAHICKSVASGNGGGGVEGKAVLLEVVMWKAVPQTESELRWSKTGDDEVLIHKGIGSSSAARSAS